MLVIKDFKNSHISRNNIGKGGVPVTVPACWHVSPGIPPPPHTCTQIVPSHRRIDQSHFIHNIHKDVFHEGN